MSMFETYEPKYNDFWFPVNDIGHMNRFLQSSIHLHMNRPTLFLLDKSEI